MDAQHSLPPGEVVRLDYSMKSRDESGTRTCLPRSTQTNSSRSAEAKLPLLKVPLFVFMVLLIMFNGVGLCVGFCPTRCLCEDSEERSRVECTHTDLELIPFLLNPNVKILNLSFNKIKSIDQSLTFYPNVDHLDLSGNLLISLEIGDLQAQSSVQIVNFSGNKLLTIKNGTLDSLVELRELNLGDNVISSLEPRAFKFLKKLLSLELSKNNLKALSDYIFTQTSKLENLKLNYNKFLSVPSNAVKELINLRNLELNGNRLSALAPSAFKTLPNLLSLFLDKNNISAIHPLSFDGLVNLVSLSVKDNRLTSIPDSAFQPIKKLEVLDLSGNLFQTLNHDSFRHPFPSLLRLYVTRCPRMTRVDSGALNNLMNLRVLHLSHNMRLVHLGSSVFASLLHLTDLDLTACGIVYIHQKQIPQGTNTRLHLAGNPLHCNCSLLWLAQLPANSSNYLDTPTCATPTNLYGVAVSEVDPGVAGCQREMSVMAVAVCVSVVVVGILIIAGFLACRWRHNISSPVHNKSLDNRCSTTNGSLYRDQNSQLGPVSTPIFAPKYRLSPAQNSFPNCLGHQYSLRSQSSGGPQPHYSIQPSTHPLLSSTNPSPTSASQLPVEWFCPSPYEDDTLHWYSTVGRDGLEYLTGELKRNYLPPPPESRPPEPPDFYPKLNPSLASQNPPEPPSYPRSLVCSPSHPKSPKILRPTIKKDVLFHPQGDQTIDRPPPLTYI